MNPEDYETNEKTFLMTAILEAGLLSSGGRTHTNPGLFLPLWEQLDIPLDRKIAFIKAGVPFNIISQYSNLTTKELIMLREHIYVLESLRSIDKNKVVELSTLFGVDNTESKVEGKSCMSWVVKTTDTPLEWLKSFLP